MIIVCNNQHFFKINKALDTMAYGYWLFVNVQNIVIFLKVMMGIHYNV